MKYSAFLVLHKNKEFKTIRQTIPMKNELAELGIENCLQKKKSVKSNLTFSQFVIIDLWTDWMIFNGGSTYDFFFV